MDEMISIEKFDGSDFGFWKMRIEDYLYSRDLYLPLEEKPENMDSEEWKILDRKAMSAIRLSLSRNVAYNTMKAKSAREMLAILEHMYQRPSTANKVHLMRQLSNLKMLEGTSVHQHLNEFNMIISQLSSIEIDFDDEVRALIMLSSLPESWARIVTTVSASSAKSKLCFDEVRDLMISEELRRKESGSSSGSAMNTEERVSKSRGESQSQLSLEERFNLIRSIGEECIQEDELERLLANKSQIICYDGFEPSGRMHIAQGVMKAINVNKLTSAGCIVKIWIADWFAKMNHKMGGDMDKIKVIGEYMIEIWKALGMNTGGGQVEFLWASKEIAAEADEYIFRVLDIATRNNLSRILRCSQIMGRSDKDELSAAQILYPCMQCADIFFLKADICQLGMDQRKVNMLAREYCDQIGRKHKPVIVSHHMLPGLLEGQEKMSKSDPSSSIFMEDEEADVNLKIKKAFCPPKVMEKNPCLEYIKYIVFPWFGEFVVERKPENGGHKNFISFDELVIDYESGELHPGDLKPALAKALNRILQPVRDHFKNDGKAKKLLKSVKNTLLAAIPSAAEIKAAVFEMASTSAPGPDGYGGSFYHSCWPIIGDDVMGAVLRFFTHNYIPQGLNSSTTVCSPRDEGGLGVGSFALINESLLSKLAWKIMVDKGIGYEMMRAKYLTSGLGQKYIQHTSSIGTSARRSFSEISEDVHCSIGDGTSVLFWLDDWLGYRLCDKLRIPEFVHKFLMQRVSDYFFDGLWHFTQGFIDAYPSIVVDILLLPLGDGLDVRFWKPVVHGQVTAKGSSSGLYRS